MAKMRFVNLFSTQTFDSSDGEPHEKDFPEEDFMTNVDIVIPRLYHHAMLYHDGHQACDPDTSFVYVIQNLEYYNDNDIYIVYNSLINCFSELNHLINSTIPSANIAPREGISHYIGLALVSILHACFSETIKRPGNKILLNMSETCYRCIENIYHGDMDEVTAM